MLAIERYTRVEWQDGLRDDRSHGKVKVNHVVEGYVCVGEQVAQGKFHGTIEEQGGKRVFKGTVATEAEKNEIWNAIKTIPTWQQDINADIRVTGGPSAASSAPPPAPAPAASAPAATAAAKTYTVKSGDTLSKMRRAPRQRRRLHEDLRTEQRPIERSRQDQARAGHPAALTWSLALLSPWSSVFMVILEPTCGTE